MSGGAGDDRVLPFAVEPLDVRGRAVAMGAALDSMLAQHAYPAPVSRTLGEAVVLTALLGSSLKFEGRFQLQTRSDGAVSMVVVDFEPAGAAASGTVQAPASMRAYARFDAARVAEQTAAGKITPADMLGQGHLALTIDHGLNRGRYQGLVELSGQGFEAAAHEYFLRSEQIPTRVRLAVAEALAGGQSTWRAGGVLVQFLPSSPERQRQRDLDPGDAPETHQKHDVPEDDAWVEARSLVDTVEDHELVDPTLPSEDLLYRLFHERGARVFPSVQLSTQCRCSREKIDEMLRRFSPQERRDMVADDGKITVTCEFCSTHYHFTPEDFPDGPQSE